MNRGGRVKHFNVGPYRCVRLSCSTFLIFSTTSMFNLILFIKLLGTVPSFTVRCIHALKLLKNRLPACLAPFYVSGKLHNQSSANLPFIAKFGKYRVSFICKYSTLTVVLITKRSAHSGRSSRAQC